MCPRLMAGADAIEPGAISSVLLRPMIGPHWADAAYPAAGRCVLVGLSDGS